MNEDQNLGGITALLWLPSGVILLASWLTERGKEKDKGRGTQRDFFFLLNEAAKTHMDAVMLNSV